MDSGANETKQVSFAAAVDLFSQHRALTLATRTCPIHECCNGSCQPDGPIRIEAPQYGERLIHLKVEITADPLPLRPTPTPFPTEPFQYHAINSEKGQIRLLRVQKAVFLADPVAVELVETTIDNPPAYAALSYHWGSSVLDHPISCNGKMLHVTGSLHGALKRHRQDVLNRRNVPELLWADAICINQQDGKELNGQLLLMRKIYHKSKHVYVDLGDLSLEWYYALDLMSRIDCNPSSKIPTTSQPEAYGLPPFDHLAWKIYLRTYSLPWFSRTWVIQEVSLASPLSVRFGRFTFEWDLLERSFEFCLRNPMGFKNVEDVETLIGCMNLRQILKIRRTFRQGGLTPIKLLICACDFGVSDPRDKIIGLLGLFPPNDNPFRPDYSWPASKLFHQFAIYVIDNVMQPCPSGSEDRQSILSYAGLHRQPDQTVLPSWVPDWTMQAIQRPEVYGTDGNKPFSAATSRAWEPYQIAESLSDPMADMFVVKNKPELLSVLSLRVDAITAMSKIFCSSGGENDGNPFERWISWQNDAETLFRDTILQKQARYPDAEDAFSRTLLANTTHRADPFIPAIDNPSECRLKVLASQSRSPKSFSSAMDNNIGGYFVLASAACESRRLAMTSDGYIGLVPACSEIGDAVYLFSGFPVPFILRDCKDGHFVLLGDAYVHGIMEGELLRERSPLRLDNWKHVLIR